MKQLTGSGFLIRSLIQRERKNENEDAHHEEKESSIYITYNPGFYKVANTAISV